MLLALLLACGPADDAADSAAPDDVARGALQLRWPLTDPALFDETGLFGVDHDPVVHGEGVQGYQCADYLGRGFPHCYDEHDGSDFLLDGGFDTMDAGSTPVVAAAAGTVVETDDGHYDRCHATVDGIDCDGHDGEPNYVIVAHADGWRTWYWHLKSGSVAVAPGDAVACGDTLGLVGSSGYSSMPHLHLEVVDPDGVVVDPYAGDRSQPETYWTDQGEADGLPGTGCAG